ncbi:unnamed protein product [Heterobilharzia americana]|nr:unnamed protein product [Heterobilharzia americana]
MLDIGAVTIIILNFKVDEVVIVYMFVVVLPEMDLYNKSRRIIGLILAIAISCFFLFVTGACHKREIEEDYAVQIIVDGIENFYRLKNLEIDRPDEALDLFSGLSFDPTFLDFGDQPLSHPKHVEVTITNIDTDQSIELVTTFGAPSFIFSSRFNQTEIAPASSATFNVTFLPYTVGEFEGFMYIQTSLGAVKYQVFGSSHISDQYLIPLVNLESLVENKKMFCVKMVNPLSYSVEVNNLKVFPATKLRMIVIISMCQ